VLDKLSRLKRLKNANKETADNNSPYGLVHNGCAVGKFFKDYAQERTCMVKETIKVNNNAYTVALNEQTQMYAMRLRRLYQQTYTDVDGFDEVSSEISATVNNLLKQAVSPEVREEDMDGVIQQVLKMYEKSFQRP
jgi:hypothetical protein